MPRREICWLASCSLAIASIAGLGVAFAQPATPVAPAPPSSAAPKAQPPPPPADSAPPAASVAPSTPPPAAPKPDPATVLPPRPPTLPYEPPAPVAWERHIEVGPDLAFVTQPASHDEHGHATGVHYNSTFGFAAHATWQMLKNFQFSVYFVDSNHGLRFDPGALGLPGQISSVDSAHTYSFGARFQPLIPFTPNIRGWLSGGIGWARWDFPRMEVGDGTMHCAPSTYVVSNCYMLYERSDNMAVFPLGIGASFDVVPRHLSFVVEFTAALPVFQSGTAISSTRAVNDAGENIKVGGLPLIDVMLVESVGLSIVL